MNKKVRRLVSLFIAVVMMMSTVMYSYADESNSQSSSTIFIDDNGEQFRIIQEETMWQRITYLYNGNNMLVETFALDKETGIMENVVTGATLQLSPQATAPLAPCAVFGDEYEYEFCSLNETYTTTEKVTVGEITGMITATVSVSTIVAVIAGYVGLSAFTGNASQKVKAVAGSILSLYQAGSTNHSVSMTFRFKCVKQWESDSSYPNGGFYFLGYLPDASYFSYKI